MRPGQAFETTCALDGVELTVGSGEVHGLLGPNGGIALSAADDSLDLYVLALAREGVAVRRLELLLSPLESSRSRARLRTIPRRRTPSGP